MKQIVGKKNDIAFYIKLYPLVKIHPQAYKNAKTIVCEKSNEKALKLLEDVFADKPIPEPACETDIVDKNIRLGEKLGISGTPTMVFQSGKKISGAPDEEKLIEMIEKNAQ